jgi:hypothetical protein
MSAPTSVYHPLFSKWISAWQDCRNAFDGQRAIKNAGTRYLPQLTGQEDEDYKAYKERALFFSITGKTISALVGMALGRAPIFKAPERMKEYGLDEWGIQIVEMICNCLTEVLLTGRYGLMLDMPEQGGDPYLARYPAENIINWSVDRQGRPTRVVLQEVVYEESDNSLGTQQREIEYRTLFINAAGVYQVDVYDDSYKNIKKSTVPTVNGMALTEIPFIIMNPIGIGWDIIKPPVLDIVDINISHYRTSADLEHGRHFTALPTPVVSGVDAASVLRIGSQTAWVLPEATAKAYYLEFQGLGLKSLETALQEKQSQLASLSARLLDNSGNGSEAVDAVRLRYMSETASLLMVVLLRTSLSLSFWARTRVK